MSERQDLNTYMFKGNGMNVVYLHGVETPTRTDVPSGCFCVIDALGEVYDHDVWIYADLTTPGTYVWTLVHNDTA